MKKLLVVLLIVVMVFALVACTPNETEEYNYFSDVYSSLKAESDIRLETIIYQQLQTMFQTPGKYLVFFGGYNDDVSQDVIKSVNDTAIKYQVPVVYNFDPNLDGGIGAELEYTTNFGNLKYTTNLNDSTLASVSSKFGYIANEIKWTLGEYDGGLKTWTPLDEVPTGQLVYIETTSAFELDSEGKIANKKVDLEGESTAYRYSITSVISEVILKSDNKTLDVEKTEESIKTVMQAGCLRVPSSKKNLSDKDEVWISKVTPIDYFSDARLHINSSGNMLEDSGSVFEIITYHEFIRMLDKETGVKGDWFVHFGGAWCKNTQAMAWLCNKWAKDYGIDKIYLFDPRIDGGASVLPNFAGDAGEKPVAINVNIRTSDVMSDSKLKEIEKPGSFMYTGLYANLLIELSGGQFQSDWNYDGASPTTDWEIKVDPKNDFDYADRGGVWAKGKDPEDAKKEKEVEYSLPRMCVPNIMLLNNSGDKGNKIKGSIEVEYEYIDTYSEELLARKELDKLLDELFKSCEYAFYNPIPEETSSGSSSAPAPAAGGGSPDC